MRQFLRIGEAHRIRVHAPILPARIRTEGEKDASMPFDMNAARGGNEVQHLLRLTGQMRRHRPVNPVIDDERQIPHACDGKQYSAHIPARHIDCDRRSGRRYGKKHHPHECSDRYPLSHTFLLSHQCNRSGCRAQRRCRVRQSFQSVSVPLFSHGQRCALFSLSENGDARTVCGGHYAVQDKRQSRRLLFCRCRSGRSCRCGRHLHCFMYRQRRYKGFSRTLMCRRKRVAQGHALRRRRKTRDLKMRRRRLFRMMQNLRRCRCILP